jgi:hypothetical protein
MFLTMQQLHKKLTNGLKQIKSSNASNALSGDMLNLRVYQTK